MSAFDPFALAAPGLRQLKPYQPGKPVEQLERELGIRDALKLASNENPHGPSPLAVAAVRAKLDGVNYYPDQHAFTARLAGHYGVAPECITLGNGSNDVLDLVARAFLVPGTNAVFSRHAFAVYPLATLACSAEPRAAAPLPADHPSMPYGHDPAALAAAIDDATRVVFIANPNNPTGTWLGEAALHDLLARLPTHVVVVLDEAYGEYARALEAAAGGERWPDGLRWLDEFPNLVVTRTFSKIYGLAGLRCGCAVSSPAIADLLNRVRHPFNANSLALAAAGAALDDTGFVERSATANAEGLGVLAAGFARLGLGTIPSRGNFVCVDVGRDAEPVYQALLRDGVIVRPVANYGLPNHLRVTVGRSEDHARVIDAFARALAA